MEKAVPIVALWLLIEMVFGAIDRALSPYEPAFYTWGGVAVFSLLLALALLERRRNTSRVRPGLSAFAAVRSRR